MGALLLHGCLDTSSLVDYKSPILMRTTERAYPAMFFLLLLFQALSASLDPLWTNGSPRKPLVARRIFVFRLIVSPILVPCQATESVVVARRNLVISPESSHHRYEAIPVFARARMCGHLPLIYTVYGEKLARLTVHS